MFSIQDENMYPCIPASNSCQKIAEYIALGLGFIVCLVIAINIATLVRDAGLSKNGCGSCGSKLGIGF